MTDGFPQDAFFDLGKTPMLFIGLGGSGGEVVARIKDLVRQQFSDPSDPAHSFFQFLVIDADGFEALPASVRRMLDKETEFCYIGGLNPNLYIREALRDVSGEAGGDLRAWLGDPPPRELLRQFPNETVSQGAMRVRQLGRLLLYASRGDVEAAILRKLQDAGEIEEAVAAAGSPSQTRKVQVFIASGACGGTGSGTFFDVVHLVGRLLYAQAALVPEIAAILILPNIHLVKHQTTGLLPYYRANGWAFWEELRYLLREPEALNEWVMDATSMRWQAAPGSGIPSGCEPLDWVYLFDNELPGQGFISSDDLSSFYASIAKAMFHHMTSLSGHLEQSLGSTLQNVRGRRFDPDNDGARKLGCAVGFSEIRFPSREVVSFLGYRLARALVEDTLLAEPDTAQVVKAVDRIKGQLQQLVLAPLANELESAVSAHWDQCKPVASEFSDTKGKLDPSKVTMEVLRRIADRVEKEAQASREEMGRIFAGNIKEFVRRFEGILAEEVRTASGYEGLGFTRDVFARFDDILESEAAGHRAAQKIYDAELKISREKLSSLDRASLIYQAARPGWGKGKQKLVAFQSHIKALFDQAVSEMKESLHADLLYYLAGEEGDRRPQLAYVDATTGRLQRRVPGTASLDRHEEEVVGPVLARYGEVADSLSDRELGKLLWAYEGRPVTSQYVPSTLKGVGSFDSLPEVNARLAAMLAGDKRQLLRGLLDACPPLEVLNPPSETATHRIVHWASSLFAKEILQDVDIFALIGKAPKERAVVQKAIAVCKPPLALSPALDVNAKETVIRLVQAPDLQKAKPLLTGFNAGHWAICPPGGVYLLSQAFLIPLSRVRALDKLRGDYFGRDKSSNFPHLKVSWSSVGVPGAERGHNKLLWTYACVRAIDWWLTKGTDKRKRSGMLSRLGVAEEPANVIPFGFTASRDLQHLRSTQKTRAYYAKMLVKQKRYWVVAKEVELTDGKSSEREAIDLLLGYIGSHDVIENHAAVLKEIEERKSSRLEEICEEWLTEVLRPAMDRLVVVLRQKPDQEPQASLYRWYRLLWQALGGHPDAKTMPGAQDPV